MRRPENAVSRSGGGGGCALARGGRNRRGAGPHTAHLWGIPEAGTGSEDTAPGPGDSDGLARFPPAPGEKTARAGCAGGVSDRSAGVGLEAVPGESDAANTDAAAMHFSVRG